MLQWTAASPLDGDPQITPHALRKFSEATIEARHHDVTMS
jgi:hypothetical protein